MPFEANGPCCCFLLQGTKTPPSFDEAANLGHDLDIRIEAGMLQALP